MNLQVAYDFTEPEKAVYTFFGILNSVGSQKLYHEVGTPLLKHGGISIVKIFSHGVKQEGGKLTVDSKTVDVADQECEGFFLNGANYVTAMAFSSDENIKDAIDLSKRYSGDVIFDIDSAYSDIEKVKRAEEIVKMGATYMNCHTGISAQIRSGTTPFRLLDLLYKKLKKYTDSRLIVAGGIKLDTLEKLEPYKDKIEIVIIGGAITKHDDPAEQTKSFLSKIESL